VYRSEQGVAPPRSGGLLVEGREMNRPNDKLKVPEETTWGGGVCGFLVGVEKTLKMEFCHAG